MRLSIITVNLNNRDGLQKTIDSVICQTFTDYEWIVIDGGSTDGSKELLEQYAEHFAYWVSEPDKGIYNAMNKGIRVAKGEYINFLNSGDCFVSKEVLSNVFETPRTVDLIFGYMMRDSLNGDINNASMMKSKITWIDLYRDGFPHQSSFIRKTLFNKYGLYDESLKVVADWTFFVKAFVYHDSTYEFVPIKISIYASNGISDVYGWDEREKVQDELFPVMIMKDIPKIESYNRIQSHWLTRVFHKMLNRCSAWIEKF